MFATVFVATLFASATVLTAEAGPSPAPPATALSRRHRPAARPPHRTRADDLFSPRFKRRLAAYLRVRMLEMRAEGLRKAADVIEGRSPLRSLFEEDASPAPYI